MGNNCHLCLERLPTSIHYRTHYIDKHKKIDNEPNKKYGMFCCDICGKTFDFEQNLNWHKKNVHFVNFKYSHEEYQTILSEEEKKYRYACEDCDKRFPFLSQLKIHLVIISCQTLAPIEFFNFRIVF